MKTDLRPMIIDAGRLHSVRLRDEQVCLLPIKGAPVTVPLQQIAQLTIRMPPDGLLALITRLVHRNRPVAFTDGRGNVIARLQPDVDVQPIVSHLADLCDTLHHSFARDYPGWRDVQQRHSLSRILPSRANRPDAVDRALVALRRLCRRHQRSATTEHAEALLISQTLLLAADLIHQRRLTGLQSALQQHGYDLARDLAEILRVTLLWGYVQQLGKERRASEAQVFRHWTRHRQALAELIIFHLRTLPDWINGHRWKTPSSPRGPQT